MASRHLPAWVPIYNCPFSKEQKLYKLEFNSYTIRLILQPLLCGGMACLSIFSGGILTYICLICSRKSQIYFHVSRFVNHFKVWTSINGMCKKKRFGFLSSFTWTSLTRLRRLQWLVYWFGIIQTQCPLQFVFHLHLQMPNNKGQVEKTNYKNRKYPLLQEGKKPRRNLLMELLF